VTRLRRFQATDDAPTFTVDHYFDRLDTLRCAPSSRATAADYSGQLGAQGWVHALGKARGHGAASFVGGKSEAVVGRDCDGHPSAHKAPVPVGPCRCELTNHGLSKSHTGQRRNGDSYARIHAANMPCGLTAYAGRCSVASRTVSEVEGVT
jgi:hypothetical protein